MVFYGFRMCAPGFRLFLESSKFLGDSLRSPDRQLCHTQDQSTGSWIQAQLFKNLMTRIIIKPAVVG